MSHKKINHEAEVAQLKLDRQYILAGVSVENAYLYTVELMDIDALITAHIQERLCECLFNNAI